MLTTAPSTRVRPSWRTGGKRPGSAALASSAGWSGPRANTTSSPVSRSRPPPAAAPRAPRRCRGCRRLRKMSRRPWLEKRWSSRVRRFHARDSLPPGNTSSPRSDSHMPPGARLRRSVGLAASTDPLNAPADVPTITSGVMPRSSRARSMPTSLTAWLPPPESTNAVRCLTSQTPAELVDREAHRTIFVPCHAVACLVAVHGLSGRGKAGAMLRPKSNPPHRRLIPARGREAHA